MIANSGHLLGKMVIFRVGNNNYAEGVITKAGDGICVIKNDKNKLMSSYYGNIRLYHKDVSFELKQVDEELQKALRRADELEQEKKALWRSLDELK